MTQPSTGPLCRDCKYSRHQYELMWCDYLLNKGKRSFSVTTMHERSTDASLGGCGPEAKNFEAKA